MTISIAPASTLDDEQLAALFTAVYAGYWHPIEIDATGLQRMVATYDLDLDASVVALDDGEPVAVAMLAVRKTEGWVGGMGVLPERRGNGLGERVTRALLESARVRQLSRVRLEVLEQNAPAIAVYRKLGFQDLGDVVVWRLDRAPDGEPTDDAEADDVLAELRAAGDDAPWQRSLPTIERARCAGTELAAVRGAGGSAIYTTDESHAALQAIAASSSRAAAALIRAPFDRGAASLFFLNGPPAGPVAEALDAAGALRLARQHELVIAP